MLFARERSLGSGGKGEVMVSVTMNVRTSLESDGRGAEKEADISSHGEEPEKTVVGGDHLSATKPGQSGQCQKILTETNVIRNCKLCL